MARRKKKNYRGNSNGQVVPRTFSGGRSVAQVWADLFRANESLPDERKLSDEEITSEMLRAFPDRTESKIFRLVNRVRGRYNRGLLTGGREPGVKSRRFVRLESGKLLKIPMRKTKRRNLKKKHLLSAPTSVIIPPAAQPHVGPGEQILPFSGVLK